MKQKRIVDEDLLAYIRLKPCIACFRTPSQPHHVTTVGARGDDVPDNLMPLCLEHHVMIHQYGWTKMIKEFPRMIEWLEEHDRVDILQRIAKR